MSEHNCIPSTLNMNNIPDEKFISHLENYNCKLNESIVKILANESGCNSSDPRVLKLLTIVSQNFIEDLLSNTADSIISKKNNNKFLEAKELAEVIKEKGITPYKSQFYLDNLNINLDTAKK